MMPSASVDRSIADVVLVAASFASAASAQPAVATLAGRVVDTQLPRRPAPPSPCARARRQPRGRPQATGTAASRFRCCRRRLRRRGVIERLRALARRGGHAAGRTGPAARRPALSRQPPGGRGRPRRHAPAQHRRRWRAAGGTHRVAAAQRPQLSRAGAARAGQHTNAGLRSDQDQQRAHRLRGPDGTRRQHHHRRPGQQRRRRGWTAAESADRCGAGVPDRHQPVRRRPRALGLVGHQRRHPLGHQHESGHGGDLRARRWLAGAAGYARQ